MRRRGGQALPVERLDLLEKVLRRGVGLWRASGAGDEAIKILSADDAAEFAGIGVGDIAAEFAAASDVAGDDVVAAGDEVAGDSTGVVAAAADAVVGVQSAAFFADALLGKAQRA